MNTLRPTALVLGCLLLGSLCTPLGAAQTAATPLQAKLRPGQTTRVEVALQVGGDLKLVTDGQPKNLPMSVVANLNYDEQLLATDTAGQPTRSVRQYTTTKAVIKVEQGGEKPTLDPARTLIVAEKGEKTAPVLYCPTARLTQPELDLIDVPGNTLLLSTLLPEKPVAAGDSWKLTDQTLCDLLGLEAVSWTDVQCALGEVKDGEAEVAAAGSVSGAVGGVSTEIELKIKYKFHLRAGLIHYAAFLIKEKRAVGHVGPGLDTVAKLIINVSPISGSGNLPAEQISKLPAAATPELLELAYVSPGGTYALNHDRCWFLTSDDPKLAIWRLLDRGELVAQCNISSLPAKGKTPTTLPEFQRDIETSLGKNFGQFVNASQDTTSLGYKSLRVVADGAVAQLPIQWIYYLLENAQSQRISVAFTFEQSLQERFGSSDRQLVSGLRLTQPPAPTAARPVKKQ